MTSGGRQVVGGSGPGRGSPEQSAERGVPRLAEPDTGRSGTLPLAVWEGLLAPAPLDPSPFRPPSADPWVGSSAFPLGVLRQAQLYSTNSDPRLQGKGHSPPCRHTRPGPHGQ